MKFLTFILALFISFSSFADKESKDEKSKGEFFKKELNLSDEQLAKVKEIRKGCKEDILASKSNYLELKKSFKEAKKNPKATNEELTAKFEAYQKARDEFQRKRFDTMLKMREVLTPAQMDKLEEVKGRYHKKFDKKMKSRKGKKEKKD